MYHFFYLEISLKNSDDSHIYGLENVSHVSTNVLIEIFKINLEKDPEILEGYFLKKTVFKKYKKYIKQNIGSLNLDIFEYCLRQYATNDFKEIRRMYKESLME